MSETPADLDVLAFAPHPDDAELFCGATLLLLSERGWRTGILDMTRGEMSSQGTLEIRARETEQAAAVLGLTVRENLGLPDGRIGAMHGAEEPAEETQLGRVVLALRRLRPRLVLLPYWEDRHPDHQAAAKLLTDALFFSGLTNYLPERLAPFRPLRAVYYQLRFAFRPSFIVDASRVHERKLAAVRCYASQLLRSPAAGPPTLISSPLSVDSISARDAYYGAMIGTAFGEPFFLRESLRIDDPLRFFLDYPQADPLMYPGE